MSNPPKEDYPSDALGHDKPDFLSDEEIKECMGCKLMGYTSPSRSTEDKEQTKNASTEEEISRPPCMAHDTSSTEESAIMEVARFSYDKFYGLPPGTATAIDIETSTAGVDGWASRAPVVGETEDTILEVARYNYEQFYGLPPGTANVMDMMMSSAGVNGWASCVIENNETLKRQRSEGSNQKTSGGGKELLLDMKKPRSDKEEEIELQKALLESVGVTIPRSISHLKDDPNEYNEYNEYEYDSDSNVSVEEGSCGGESYTEVGTEESDTHQDKIVVLPLEECAVYEEGQQTGEIKPIAVHDAPVTSNENSEEVDPANKSLHTEKMQTKTTSSGYSSNSNLNWSTPRKNDMVQSSSVLRLDDMISQRKKEGDFKSNIVHIEGPFGKPIEDVYEGVHNGPVLGSGISGLVRLVTHKATGVKYAVKCLDLGLIYTEEGLQQLREEIFNMCQLDHPNIVRLEEVYESESRIYLVQELCSGGELFDRLDEQPEYHYTEAQCARLVKQMLCSVRYIHSKGIIHRNLKLEKFVFSDDSPDSELKMIGFGLSKHFKFGEVQREVVGTPYTVAPEVIRGSYDERCDVWAIGVITYLLFSGDTPFGGCGGAEPLTTVRANILKGSFAFDPPEVWSTVSSDARRFITSLLVTDPDNRPTAWDAQKLEWLQKMANKDRTEGDNQLNPGVVKALVNFKEYSDMRKLLCEVLSFTLLPDQIQELRKEFEKMDTEGSGKISLGALKEALIGTALSGSLGALTEEEVEDIFNAMRVRKTETTIHWHEFIAAGLSQCKVDDRNLRLAFDRLDSDHKGYITFDNVVDLMGNDAAQSEDSMRRMWGDSVRACSCNHDIITYEDFLLLMKGQTKEVGDTHLEPHEASHEQKKIPNKIRDDECDDESDGSQEDFVFVHEMPKISRTSWQWDNLVKSLERTKKSEAGNIDKCQDGSSGEWSLV